MNMKNIIRQGLIVLFIMATGASAQLVNPGFEKTQQVSEKEGFQKNLQGAGWKFDEPLVFPEGWRPNPGAFKNGEYRLVTDSKLAHSGDNCVFLKGHLSHSKAIDVTAGDELEISVHVKDAGKKTAGICFYFYTREKGRNIFSGSKQFNIKTEPEWLKQTVMLTIPEETGGKRVNAIIIALVSVTGAYFDDVELNHKRTAKWLNFQDAFMEGNKKAGLGNFAEARDDYNMALGLTQNRKERIETFLKISETYIKENNYIQAVEVFNTVIDKEKPDDALKVDMNLKIADAYMKAKEYEKARERLGGVLNMGKEADSVKVDALLAIADAWLKEKNYAQAIDAFEKVFGMKQAGNVVKVAVQFKIGDTCVAMKDNEKARETYLKVLSMQGTSFVDKFEANKKIGDLYRNEKKYEKAREFYEKALSVEDVNDWSEAALLAILADTYAVEGRYEEARRTYGRILDMSSKPWNNKRIAYAKIGEIYRKEGKYDKERETYAAMVDWVSNDMARLSYGAQAEVFVTLSQMLRLTGDSYWAEGNKEKAKEYYLRFLEIGRISVGDRFTNEVETKIGKNQAASHIRKAESLFFAKKYEESIAEFGRVLNAKDADLRQKSVATERIGDVYLAMGDYNKAREKYMSVLGIKDMFPEERIKAQMLMGESYAVEKKYQQARAEYAKIAGMDGITSSDKIEAQEKIAEMYRAELNYSQARTEYGKILKMEGLSDSQQEEIKERMLSIYR
ncbi:MAG TPA: tetratricopeptide repeat protein [bacterium]|nr:tetratricopeptide repeat protein [bacterium]